MHCYSKYYEKIVFYTDNIFNIHLLPLPCKNFKLNPGKKQDCPLDYKGCAHNIL